MKFYLDQGMSTLTGYDRFFVGNMVDMGTIEKNRKQDQGVERREALLQMLAKDNGDPPFEASNHPMCVLNLFSTLRICVSDPEIVQQLYTTHSRLIDKNGITRDLFDPLLGYSFIFTKND